MKATTQIALQRNNVTIYIQATGNPLHLKAARNEPVSASSHTLWMALADVDALVAAGWLPLGDLTAFREAAIRGEKHHG